MMINQPVTGGEFEFVPHMRDKVAVFLYIICIHTHINTHIHTHTQIHEKKNTARNPLYVHL